MNLTLFDLDGTLIERDSDHAFGEFMVRVGWADGDAWRDRNDEFYRQYQAGALDLAAYVDFATSAWRSQPIEAALAMRERFIREEIKPSLHPRALALVRSHQAEGDLVAIVTATNEFVTRPIADQFGIDTLLAVELERDEAGGFTGRVRGTPTFREGKVARVASWLASLGHRLEDFPRVNFYSDSINDLPLLEAVTDPIATNASPALAQIAAERGWRTLGLFQ